MAIVREKKQLKDFIPMDRVKEATNEFEQKLSRFREKYYDPMIEKFISTIKGADMKYIINMSKWVFKYPFAQVDIQNLDPKKPEYAQQIVDKFIDEVCEDLCIEKIRNYFEIPKTDKEPIYLIIEFKNPLK